MGASSYVLAGTGAESALSSACHGAGQTLSRGDSRRFTTKKKRRKELDRLRIVAPSIPSRPGPCAATCCRVRAASKSPYAYKDITPVIDTVQAAHIADRVARLFPLLTIKG